MFDDQNQNKNSSGTTPPNLPIGEPDDMFAATDNAASPMDSSPTKATPPAPPTALDAGVLQPKTESQLPPSQPQPSSSPSHNTENMFAGVESTPAPASPQQPVSPPPPISSVTGLRTSQWIASNRESTTNDRTSCGDESR